MKKEMNYLGMSVLLVMFTIMIGTSFASSWVGTDTRYYTEGKGCFVDKNYAEWTETTGGDPPVTKTLKVVFNSSGNVGNCSEFSEETNETCCPAGYRCVNSKCVPEVNDPCEEFGNRRECENANMNTIGDNPAERYFRMMNQTVYNNKCDSGGSITYYDPSKGYCSNFSGCECYWNGSKCKTSWQDYKLCEDGSTDVTGRCDYEVLKTETLCDTIGKIIVTYKTTPSPNNLEGCTPPQPREVSCSAVVVVPFFTFTNFILSLVGVLGIYFVVVRKK